MYQKPIAGKPWVTKGGQKVYFAKKLRLKNFSVPS